jgi:hypothetical protein
MSGVVLAATGVRRENRVDQLLGRLKRLGGVGENAATHLDRLAVTLEMHPAHRAKAHMELEDAALPFRQPALAVLNDEALELAAGDLAREVAEKQRLELAPHRPGPLMVTEHPSEDTNQ